MRDLYMMVKSKLECKIHDYLLKFDKNPDYIILSEYYIKVILAYNEAVIFNYERPTDLKFNGIKVLETPKENTIEVY